VKGLAFVFAAGLSCAPAAPPPWPSATPQTWPILGRALEDVRDARPREPWAAGLRITMHDPRSGRVVDGRGAIAVAPGRAVRMILIAGAGATVLDAWVTASRWRVAVPPLDVVRRGGADAPSDLPVGFLRWWLLTPVAGALFAAAFTREGFVWLLRDEGAVIELREAVRALPAGACARGSSLRATRRQHGHTEKVDECRTPGAPTVGDSAAYVDEASGLRVDLVFESVASTPPASEAFEDPDKAGGGT
jgi:hypothetical protein